MEKRMFWLLVGGGYWIQGFRTFPWLGVVFFLINSLRMDSGSLQILQSCVAFPMVAKPVYGILSDALPILGAHRIPYIIIGGFLQAISWGAIAFIPAVGSSASLLTMFLLLSNLGASIVEVANDALVAEIGKSTNSTSGEIQSFALMAAAVGGVLGNLLGGIALSYVETRIMFIIFGVILAIQVITCLTIKEHSLGLPSSEELRTPMENFDKDKVDRSHAVHSNSDQCPSQVSKGAMNGIIPPSVRKQCLELASALKQPEIARSLAWLSVSYAMIPLLAGTIFFYQTQHLKLDPKILGLSKVVGQLGLLLGSVVYNSYLKKISPRKLLAYVQILLSICMLSDIILVKQLNVTLGIPNSIFILGASPLIEVIAQFKILPFSVLLAQLCPPACVGSLMAIVMSVQSLSMIISGFLGAVLASLFKISPEDYSSLPLAIFFQSLAALIPLTWMSFIPDKKPEKLKKHD